MAVDCNGVVEDVVFVECDNPEWFCMRDGDVVEVVEVVRGHGVLCPCCGEVVVLVVEVVGFVVLCVNCEAQVTCCEFCVGVGGGFARVCGCGLKQLQTCKPAVTLNDGVFCFCFEVERGKSGDGEVDSTAGEVAVGIQGVV